MKKLLIFSILIILVCITLIGCGKHDDKQKINTITATDSVGRQVEIPQKVERVAVANRYNTEIIKSIGAIDKVIGVDYGIFQDQEAYGNRFSKEQIIGKSQTALNYEKIIELNPQVLVLPSNGTWEDAIKKLEPFGIKVVVLDPFYADKFKESYTLAGKVFNKEKEAKEFIDYFSKIASAN